MSAEAAICLNLFLAAVFLYILYWVIRHAVAGGIADAEKQRETRLTLRRLPPAGPAGDPQQDE